MRRSFEICYATSLDLSRDTAANAKNIAVPGPRLVKQLPDFTTQSFVNFTDAGNFT